MTIAHATMHKLYVFLETEHPQELFEDIPLKIIDKNNSSVNQTFNSENTIFPNLFIILTEFDIVTIITNFSNCTQFQQNELSWYPAKLLIKRMNHVLKIKKTIQHNANKIKFGKKKKAQEILKNPKLLSQI